ncbi:hypothetical protein [Kitasatospora sp. NPDC093102]|uniref:hypothetical protein n=1 Tax=Kitasatospora sp. NPDC093102 TaxID=3155069 RepID=UPI003427D13C
MVITASWGTGRGTPGGVAEPCLGVGEQAEAEQQPVEHASDPVEHPAEADRGPGDGSTCANMRCVIDIRSISSIDANRVCPVGIPGHKTVAVDDCRMCRSSAPVVRTAR